MREAANPGKTVPFDAVRGRFQDVAHISNPRSKPSTWLKRMANGDFVRWASRAKDAVVNGADAAGREIESDARSTANEMVHDVREVATEIIQKPGETVRDAAIAVVEAEESGEIPPPKLMHSQLRWREIRTGARDHEWIRAKQNTR